MTLIEPGVIKTDWGIIAADHLAESAKGGSYEQIASQKAQGIKKQYTSNWGSSPATVAKTILKSVNRRKPKARYLVGFGARELVFFKTLLPTRLFDIIIKNVS